MRVKITSGGQISIPAHVRRRWSTVDLELDDQGDYVVLRPASTDPITAARGALAGGATSSDLRRRARQDEIAAESRRTR